MVNAPIDDSVLTSCRLVQKPWENGYQSFVPGSKNEAVSCYTKYATCNSTVFVCDSS